MGFFAGVSGVLALLSGEFFGFGLQGLLVVVAFVVDGLGAVLGAGSVAAGHLQVSQRVVERVDGVVDDGGGGGFAQGGEQYSAAGVGGVGLALR